MLSKIKPYLRWLILGVTLFFVAYAFKKNWQAIATVRLTSKSFFILIIALIVTLFAHLWSGWVWTWILKEFKQNVYIKWALKIYLITNLAKYFPGNIGHFYGRIAAVHQAGSTIESASISVLLEPLLMATAALFIAIVSSSFGLIEINNLGLQLLILIAILCLIHPRVLNIALQKLSKSKGKQLNLPAIQLKQYLWLPLLGEIIFVLLRGCGFLLTWLALMKINTEQILPLLSSFSFAWLMGLVVPGAPGGMGIFEATAIALLNHQHFPAGILLTTVALFRVISILAELLGAGLGLLLNQEK
ncbi:lysylphosphatidylglycerol synthase domain-containing protein [Aphanothece hegewaldii]|nr:lysylphosphatidylglycerol synthase domain-containing protein [Aphanothece hegewaldii]